MRHAFTSCEPISKGWSGDRKYCVTDASGLRFLLRVSPAEQVERKKKQYDLMCRVAELGIPMCAPVAFGVSGDGVYTLQRWIDGEDAESAAPMLSDEDRYAYGWKAGEILQKIHTIPAPDDAEDWADRFNRKTNRKIERYLSCPLKYENGQRFIDYIEAHRDLLEGRPQTYQHGDYHVGNMMIGRDKLLYIIDFDRDDYGDPWEEFNRIVWCAQAMPAFAAGMVDGYFGGNVPIRFWQLLLFYISSNTLSSLPWAIPFGKEQVRIMVDQAQDVLRWFDDLNDPVPTWYRQWHDASCETANAVNEKNKP